MRRDVTQVQTRYGRSHCQHSRAVGVDAEHRCWRNLWPGSQCGPNRTSEALLRAPHTIGAWYVVRWPDGHNPHHLIANFGQPMMAY
jgi:hypothetical protein